MDKLYLNCKEYNFYIWSAVSFLIFHKFFLIHYLPNYVRLFNMRINKWDGIMNFINCGCSRPCDSFLSLIVWYDLNINYCPSNVFEERIYIIQRYNNILNYFEDCDEWNNHHATISITLNKLNYNNGFTLV